MPATIYTIQTAPDATATIKVTVSPDPLQATSPAYSTWYAVQIRIDGRLVWAASHPVVYADSDHHLQVAGSALASLHGYVSGSALAAGSTNHVWRGWAEQHAEAVRMAHQAMLPGSYPGVTVTRTEDATDLWTTTQVADRLGIQESAVSSTMQRAGVSADSREPGRGGRNRYRADLVRAAQVHMPGRGARTDLMPQDAQ